MPDRLKATLRAGVDQMGLALDDACIDQFAAYLYLLEKWNRVYNLTAVRQLDRMVPDHIFDSLSLLEHLHGNSLLDIGSGAGLPGIPLAIAAPQLDVCLLDSNIKKTRFLVQAQTELMLDNVRVVSARAEDFLPTTGFDTVVSRAFSNLAEFVVVASNKCAQGGQMLAMKGKRPEAEIAALPEAFKVASIHRLAPPGVVGERCLVAIEAKT